MISIPEIQEQTLVILRQEVSPWHLELVCKILSTSSSKTLRFIETDDWPLALAEVAWRNGVCLLPESWSSILPTEVGCSDLAFEVTGFQYHFVYQQKRVSSALSALLAFLTL